MKKYNKVIAIILVSVILISIFCFTALAYDGPYPSIPTATALNLITTNSSTSSKYSECTAYNNVYYFVCPAVRYAGSYQEWYCTVLVIGSVNPAKCTTDGTFWLQGVQYNNAYTAYAFNFKSYGNQNSWQIGGPAYTQLNFNTENAYYSGYFCCGSQSFPNGTDFYGAMKLVNFDTANPTSSWENFQGSDIFFYNDLTSNKPIGNNSVDSSWEIDDFNQGDIALKDGFINGSVGDIIDDEDYQDTLDTFQGSMFDADLQDNTQTTLLNVFASFFGEKSAIPNDLTINFFGQTCTILSPTMFQTEAFATVRTILRIIIVFYFLEWFLNMCLGLWGMPKIKTQGGSTPDLSMDASMPDDIFGTVEEFGADSIEGIDYEDLGYYDTPWDSTEDISYTAEESASFISENADDLYDQFDID